MKKIIIKTLDWIYLLVVTAMVALNCYIGLAYPGNGLYAVLAGIATFIVAGLGLVITNKIEEACA